MSKSVKGHNHYEAFFSYINIKDITDFRKKPT